MYISKIKIKNFRSIGEKGLEIDFIKGKNVIVGKNNAGKSNVLKAISLILGDYCFNKDKDIHFLKNDIENKNVEIVLTIQKENDDDFNNISNFSVFEEEALPCFIYYDPPKNKSKFISNKNSFDASIIEFRSVNSINFIFSFSDKYGFEEFYFWYRKNNKFNISILKSFNSIKKYFIVNILESFREPKNILKLNDYSWYGKLMQKIVDKKFEKEVEESINNIISISKKYFSKYDYKINKITEKGAFQDTELSISVVPDFTNGFWRYARINADDGYKSDFIEKGSGLQSAVIIGLFIYYIQEIATKQKQSSLFCLEEPEIYLHPQGRRVINNKVDEYLTSKNTQAIIVTHSTDFIDFSNNEKLNLIKINKENGLTSQKQISDFNKDNKFILKNKENLELFFADCVILCEGADKYVLEKIAEEMTEDFEELEKNWLDNRNISILSLDGKGNFKKYIKILKDLNIKWFVLGDLDNLTDTTFTNYLEDKITKNELEKIKNFYDENKKLNQKKIKDFLEKTSTDKTNFFKMFEECVENNKIISEELEKNYDHIKLIKLGYKLKDFEKDYALKKYIKNVIEKLKEKNIFILSKGDLEDYDKNKILGNHQKIPVIEKIQNLKDTNKKLSNEGFESEEFEKLLMKVANLEDKNRKIDLFPIKT